MKITITGLTPNKITHANAATHHVLVEHPFDFNCSQCMELLAILFKTGIVYVQSDDEWIDNSVEIRREINARD